jgi:hypothetical protein
MDDHEWCESLMYGEMYDWIEWDLDLEELVI